MVIIKHKGSNTLEYIFMGPVVSLIEELPRCLYLQHKGDRLYLPLGLLFQDHIEIISVSVFVSGFTLSGNCGNLAFCNLFIKIFTMMCEIHCFLFDSTKSILKTFPYNRCLLQFTNSSRSKDSLTI